MDDIEQDYKFDPPNEIISYDRVFWRQIKYGEGDTEWIPFPYAVKTYNELAAYTIYGGREAKFSRIRKTNLADGYGYEYWGVQDIPDGLPDYLWSPGVSVVMIDG